MAIDKQKDKSSDDMILKPDMNITFGNKASLKRSEETGIPLEDEMVIAIMEGDVKGVDVDAELASLYASTIVRPDQSIAYPDTSSLKKGVVLIPAAKTYAAAAVILLIISIGVWLTFSPGSSPQREQYILAILDNKPVMLEENNINYTQMSTSINGSSMISARVEHELPNIVMKKSDPIQVQYSIAISDQMSDFTPPNIQPPKLVPSGVEGPNTYLASTDEPKKRTLVGKVFSGMFNRVKAPFERNEAQAKPGPEKGFSIWNIADMGVKGVNTLGDHDYTLVRDYNEKGKVKRVLIVDE